MYKLFRLLTVAAALPLSVSTLNGSEKGIHYSGVIDDVSNEDEDHEETAEGHERPWYYHQHLLEEEEEEDPTNELENDTAWPAKRPDFTDFR